MQTTYLTCDGDVLDAICFKRYGASGLSATVVAVLEANPGLADSGAVFKAGTAVILPALEAPVEQNTLSLWD